jgi:chromosome segregation ATPase
VLRQHESTFALIRHAEQLERDNAEFAQGKAQLEARLNQANGRLTQEKATLQRQLDEHERSRVEDAHHIAQLQHQVQQKEDELDGMRQGHAKATKEAAAQAR